MNDPNGLVFYRDRWHLFYQYYNPAEIDGMQWGHASSADLLHWEPHAPALQPDALGQIWSGSAVVDVADSSGLFGGQPGLVCFFTYWCKEDHQQSQGAAWSVDGLQFHKVAQRPLIPQLRHQPGQGTSPEFRDPKVFWHAASGRWVMVVAGGQLRIYTSADLTHWEFATLQAEIETECPDLFPLSLDGEGAASHWVFSGGGRWYQVGGFDGRRFIPQTEVLPLGLGPDFYATQTWDSAPGGRRVAISWIHGWSYGNALTPEGIRDAFGLPPPHGGCLGLPCELTLVAAAAGPRLRINPVVEVEALREAPLELPPRGPLTLAGDRLELLWTQASDESCQLQLDGGPATQLVLAWDPLAGVLSLDRQSQTHAAVPGYVTQVKTAISPSPAGLGLRVFLDRRSIEVFVNAGEHLLSAFVAPGEEAHRVRVQFGSDRLPPAFRAWRLRATR